MKKNYQLANPLLLRYSSKCLLMENDLYFSYTLYKILLVLILNLYINFVFVYKLYIFIIFCYIYIYMLYITYIRTQYKSSYSYIVINLN